MEKSILLQKQVRDNTDDLRSEYLDMKNWEEQMRRKDNELLNAVGDQVLPAVRSRKKTVAQKNKAKPKEQTANTKRIKSSDYSEWDKFDVEKACKDVDESNESESGDEEMSNEELERQHEQALVHKEQGNLLVKKQQWTEAVKCYNEAIKIFPYDAIFYANRALCHLKIDNLHSAESDCTAAVQLDECYVKAYLRRATARKELKQYKEAKQDLEKVLQLEPTNKDARLMLQQVAKKIDTAKLVATTTPKIDDNASMEKKIGEKICGNPVQKVQSIEKKSTSKESSEKIIEAKKDSVVKSVSVVTKGRPVWTLGEGENVSVVQPISKPPHQRSKKPLKRILVREIKLGETEVSADAEMTAIREIVPSVEVSRETELKSTDTVPTELPPIPRTTVQFFMHWKKNKDADFRFRYLRQIPADSIDKIFKDSMEPDTFSEILMLLESEFIRRKEPVFAYLENLSKVKRFGALTMFMSAVDKKALNNIFEYCSKHENKLENEIGELQEKYEI